MPTPRLLRSLSQTGKSLKSHTALVALIALKASKNRLVADFSRAMKRHLMCRFVKGLVRMVQELSNRRRKRHLCLMLTDGEAEILEARAKARGLKKSAYARDILFGSPAKEAEQKERALRLEEASSDIRSALHELKKQGNNLNQVAYILNRDGARGVAEESVSSAADMVKSAACTLVELIERLR